MKKNQASFAEKPAIGALRALFPVISKLAPGVATKMSLHIFLTPQRFRTPQWEMEHQNSANRSAIFVEGRRVETYTWGTGARKVLLCHSWGGRGTQLGSFIQPLVGHGFTVITFDAPAHGRSMGKRTDMMEYSSTINEIVKHHGGVEAIIGHSFGAGNTMFSKHRYGFEVKKIVLIASFAHGIWVTERFGEILNIPSKILVRMRKLLESKYRGQLRWDDLDIARMVNEDPSRILVVHDKDDQEIPYFNAMRFLEVCGGKIVLVDSEQLGHRRVLRDPRIIGEVCEFVAAA